MTTTRSCLVLLLTTSLALVLAPPAHGRHNFSMLRVNPGRVAAGEEVTVSGFSYPVNTKVRIRFNGLEGPVLAELDPDSNQDIRGSVVIPADTAPGRYVLFAVQYDAAGKPNRIPGRAAITVQRGGAAPAVATGFEVDRRPVDLVRDEGAGPGQLVLAGIVAAGLAGLLALLAVRATGRRKPVAAAEAGGPK